MTKLLDTNNTNRVGLYGKYILGSNLWLHCGKMKFSSLIPTLGILALFHTRRNSSYHQNTTPTNKQKARLTSQYLDITLAVFSSKDNTYTCIYVPLSILVCACMSKITSCSERVVFLAINLLLDSWYMVMSLCSWLSINQ